MQSDEISAQLTEIFRQMFADDDIILTPQTTAKDVEGWDSFAHLSLMVAVETRFGVKMTTSEIDGQVDVGALIAAIEGKLARQAGTGLSN